MQFDSWVGNPDIFRASPGLLQVYLWGHGIDMNCITENTTTKKNSKKRGEWDSL